MRITLLAVASLLATRAIASAEHGWFFAGSQPASYEFGIDTGNPHGGATCAFIKARGAQIEGFGTLMQIFPAERYLNARIRLIGYMRTEQVARAQMWLRVDGAEKKVLRFDNMAARPLIGTTPWQRYEIVLDVPDDARNIAFGFFLAGGGTVWADDFAIERADGIVSVASSSQFGPSNLDFETGAED